MKHIYKNLIYGTLCIALVFGVYIVAPKTTKVRANQGLQVVSTNTSNPLATSTVTYLPIATASATTTLTLSTQNVDQVGLNIAFNASTTLAVLNWSYEYSANNKDWFPAGQQLNANASTTIEVQDGNVNSWTFNARARGTSQPTVALKHVDINNLATPYFRIVFYMAPGSSAGGVYAQAVLKQNNTI